MRRLRTPSWRTAPRPTTARAAWGAGNCLESGASLGLVEHAVGSHRIDGRGAGGCWLVVERYWGAGDAVVADFLSIYRDLE